MWSGPDSLAGADAVLITHQHADHLDPDVVRAALDRDRQLELWTAPDVAAQLADFGRRVHAVRHGDSFTAAGFEVRVYGAEHAPVHPDLPTVPNVGFAIDQNMFHPGDAFTVPDEPVRTLLLPISAPWLKASEMVDYARSVRPQVSYAIHDELASSKGLTLIGQLADRLLGEVCPYLRLEPGASAEI
jgi:L-ascorbate metabolism protein UlaG (beta-lactamase superfamily)